MSRSERVVRDLLDVLDSHRRGKECPACDQPTKAEEGYKHLPDCAIAQATAWLSGLLWRCESCGEDFSEERFSHSRAEHARDCDGNCRNCPVQVECGPINALESASEAEAVRWQERIASTIADAGLRPWDASGNESGDPLDWTDDQVRHALEDARRAALREVWDFVVREGRCASQEAVQRYRRLHEEMIG